MSGERGPSSSLAAEWQRAMMEHDPTVCWAFLAPDRVCILMRPCPVHGGISGAEYVLAAAERLAHKRDYGYGTASMDQDIFTVVGYVRRQMKNGSDHV